MTSEEAMDLVEQGEKARISTWSVGSYVAKIAPQIPTTNVGARDVVAADATYPQNFYFEGGVGAGVLFDEYASESLSNDWVILP